MVRPIPANPPATARSRSASPRTNADGGTVKCQAAGLGARHRGRDGQRRQPPSSPLPGVGQVHQRRPQDRPELLSRSNQNVLLHFALPACRQRRPTCRPSRTISSNVTTNGFKKSTHRVRRRYRCRPCRMNPNQMVGSAPRAVEGSRASSSARAALTQSSSGARRGDLRATASSSVKRELRSSRRRLAHRNGSFQVDSRPLCRPIAQGN